MFFTVVAMSATPVVVVHFHMFGRVFLEMLLVTWRWWHMAATVVSVMMATIAVIVIRTVVRQIIPHASGAHGNITIGTCHTHKYLRVCSRSLWQQGSEHETHEYGQ